VTWQLLGAPLYPQWRPAGTGDDLDQLDQRPDHHRDPFDRMLVAQALVQGATLVSHDRVLEPYGAALLWT
jgi:PIN domain nuclease of toxin-antitoxin system